MIAPTLSQLHDLLERLPGINILCVGDVILDHFTQGTVERISPEAPIPVFHIRHNLEMLGGTGNTAANVNAAGGTAHLLSVVGQDTAGDKITALSLQKFGAHSALIVETARQTSVKQRFVAGTQQLLRADTETIAPIRADSATALLAAFDKALPHMQAVLISDYGKGVLTAPILASIIKIATAAGIPVLVDPKGSDYKIYHGATLITPNRKELTEASGLSIKDDDEITTAARALLDRAALTAVVSTRGPEGMSVITAQEATHIPTRAREVWDVSGAGDTVIALLALGLGAGADLVTAAHLANTAAGIVVGKVGTATASAHEIQQALDEQNYQLVHQKHVNLNQAKEQVIRWRRQDKKIGFTNGVFDLLHPGHLASLRQAKQYCDKLIVGINSDASVKRLKGPTRPIQSDDTRATIIAALDIADLVIVFEEDTPLILIETLLPDVLVKGGDYTVEQVVGADIVQHNGGKVVIASIIEGLSTTNTIKRLHKAHK